MKLVSKYICDKVLLDKDNKLSIIGIFDFMRAIQFPYTHPTLALIFTVHGEPGEEHEYYFAAKDPSKTVMFSTENAKKKAKFSPTGKAHITTTINMLTFPIAGDYEFILHMGDLKETVGMTVEPPDKG